MEKIMLVPVDTKAFQAKLNAYCPDQPYTEAEATEAFHNLVGFVRLLRAAEQEICGRNISPHHVSVPKPNPPFLELYPVGVT
jgi:hypothetical protein